MLKRLLVCSCLSAGCFSDAPPGADSSEGGTTDASTTGSTGPPGTSTTGPPSGTTGGKPATGSTGGTGESTDAGTSTGTSSSSSSSSESGSTGAPATPDAGTIYAHCYTDADCDDPLTCFRIEGNGRGACTTACTVESDCAEPAWFGDWSGSALCHPLWDTCIADCTADETCPSDMWCDPGGFDPKICFWLDP